MDTAAPSTTDAFNFESQRDYFQARVREFNNNSKIKFLRFGAAADIFHNTKKIKQRVVPLLDFRNDIDDDGRESIARRILGPPGLCTILLVILCYGNHEMLKRFRAEFLEKDNGLNDEALPFEQSHAEMLFGRADGRNFHTGQKKFTPFVFEEGAFRASCPSWRRMPYLEEKLLGEGHYGKVFKVKIERKHFIGRNPASRNADPIYLARKDFCRPDYDGFKAEDHILKEFSSTSNCPSSIMTSVGSIVRSPSDNETAACSIFFPAALSNLYDYITNSNNWPSTPVAKLKNIANMLGICEGLKWLSKNLVYLPGKDRFELATYYHCDLKPQNILVCEQGGRDDRGSVIFKIADFGQAQGLKRKRKGETPDEQRLTIKVRDEATYLAPEMQGAKASTVTDKSDKSDVWPFGCILLLVLLFNEENAQAVKDFEKTRREKYEGESPDRRGSSDRFYWMKNNKIIINPAVDECIDHMLKLRKDDAHEPDKDVVEKSLNYLRNSIFVRYKNRAFIQEVWDELLDYYNQRTPLDLSANSIDHQKQISGDRSISSGRTSRGGGGVWKHSMHSPGGHLVFFYSSERISVHTTDGTNIRCKVSPELNQLQWSHKLEPHSSYCADNAVCIVSEPGDQRGYFEFAIRDVPQPPKNDARCRTRHGTKINIRGIGASDVSKVALSSDSKHIAVACGAAEDGTIQLRMYNIELLAALQPDSSSSSSMGSHSSSSTSKPPIAEELDILRDSDARLQRASYTLGLCFSGLQGNQILYHSYRSKNLEGRDSNVHINLWREDTGDHVGECVIPDIDPSYERGVYFTSFTSFNTEPGFLAITHTRRLWRWTKSEGLSGPTCPVLSSAKTTRSKIQRVLVSGDDRFAVLLATGQKEQLEVYIATPKDLDEPRKIEYTILKNDKAINFHPQKDSASILEHEGEDGGNAQLIFTSFSNKMSYFFDLGSLAPPSDV